MKLVGHTFLAQKTPQLVFDKFVLIMSLIRRTNVTLEYLVYHIAFVERFPDELQSYSPSTLKLPSFMTFEIFLSISLPCSIPYLISSLYDHSVYIHLSVSFYVSPSPRTNLPIHLPLLRWIFEISAITRFLPLLCNGSLHHGLFGVNGSCPEFHLIAVGSLTCVGEPEYGPRDTAAISTIGMFIFLSLLFIIPFTTRQQVSTSFSISSFYFTHDVKSTLLHSFPPLGSLVHLFLPSI